MEKVIEQFKQAYENDERGIEHSDFEIMNAYKKYYALRAGFMRQEPKTHEEAIKAIFGK